MDILETREKICLIVVEMHTPHILLIKIMFSNAKISIDRFHLMQLINLVFNKFRIETVKKISFRNRLKNYPAFSSSIKYNFFLRLISEKESLLDIETFII
ncbi:MAG: transposase [Fusobacteriaceae bacterium]